MRDNVRGEIILKAKDGRKKQRLLSRLQNKHTVTLSTQEPFAAAPLGNRE